MSTGTSIYDLTPDEITLLKSNKIIPQDTPDEVIALFSKVVSEKKLSPFQRQVHLTSYRTQKPDNSYETRYSIVTGIDGYRAQAARTGLYAGSDDAVFNDRQSEFNIRTTWKSTGPADYCHPITATVTVYKMIGGQRCAFTATAGWNSYVPQGKADFMWKKLAFLMLSKVAEALALRKAFPDELDGIYLEEEIPSMQRTIAHEPSSVDQTPMAKETDIDVLKEKVKEMKKYKMLQIEAQEATRKLGNAYTKGELTSEKAEEFLESLQGLIDDAIVAGSEMIETTEPPAGQAELPLTAKNNRKNSK